MNDGSATPLGCTVGGIGGAPVSTAGNANALRSPATDVFALDTTTPATPATAPAANSPSVTSDSRRPRSGTSGSSATLASSDSSVNRPDVSRRSTATPHTVPTAVGTMSPIVAPARDSTAAHPATPASTITALPIGTRRRSHDAATAATIAMTPSTTIDRKSLSAVPNVAIAHSLTGPGVRSMTVDPTAVRESEPGPTNAASNWVTPSETAAAAIPAIARVPLAAMQDKLPIRLPESLTEK
jgi:hypothetical protein